MAKVTLYDFWAVWCAPCKIMNPIIEEIEKEYTGKVGIVKVNVDEPASLPLVERYQVGAMPTYIIESDNQVFRQFVGAQNKRTLTEALDQALT